ncbi:MAG: DCC1-like thiol-disulfide oxidoreductase family protein [Armatimonadota bacterium]|nr:DUF393 domain-containing protein [Armatimonadota bacterium]MDW8103474.1 DCC1-like thiol-disulfide oxidoreductase family protein [Armatimonadota bacterium]MDW8290026.1 DCC1-like thiol-disulfide oxidoreductase family protein [Armatimonadota bacterium]
MEGKHWLFWDGECAFCQRCAEWVQRRDRERRFLVVPYQQAPSPPMDEGLRAACEQAVQVLRADGTLLGAGRAVLFVLEELGYRWARWFGRKPLIYVVERAYRWVARHRGLFSGGCRRR